MARFTDTGILTTDEAFKLVKSNVIKVVDEINLDPTLDGVAEALKFTYTPTDRHDGIVTSLRGVLDLEEINELDSFPLISDNEGPTKGFKMKKFAGRHVMSKDAVKWLKANIGAETLPETVKQEIASISNQMVRLAASAKKAKNFLATKVFIDGFTNNNDNGPGSSTPYGNPLFYASHPVGETGETQSNIMTGADAPLSQVNLLKALEKLRGMKDGNGTIVGFGASSYTLIIGYEQEALARKILNDGKEVASMVADVQVTNDITVSVFQMEGFKINLLVLPTIGQPSKKGKIGTGKEWFLYNHELSAELEAFRFFSLYEAEIDSWINPDNKASVVDIDASFAMDFYNPEVVVGSQGV